MSGTGEEVYSSLREQFKGDLLLPGDAAYEASRGIWNGMFRSQAGADCTLRRCKRRSKRDSRGFFRRAC